jgi:predicted ATP-dependent protease
VDIDAVQRVIELQYGRSGRSAHFRTCKKDIGGLVLRRAALIDRHSDISPGRFIPVLWQ